MLLSTAQLRVAMVVAIGVELNKEIKIINYLGRTLEKRFDAGVICVR